MRRFGWIVWRCGWMLGAGCLLAGLILAITAEADDDDDRPRCNWRRASCEARDLDGLTQQNLQAYLKLFCKFASDGTAWDCALPATPDCPACVCEDDPDTVVVPCAVKRVRIVERPLPGGGSITTKRIKCLDADTKATVTVVSGGS